MRDSTSIRALLLAWALLAVAGCTPNGSLVAVHSPTPTPTPGPKPRPIPVGNPIPIPAWAATQATCSGTPTAHEAVLVMQGSTDPILADVTDARYPQAICNLTPPSAGSGTFTGSWSPQLVTQTMVSWLAKKGEYESPAQSIIAVLDLFTGTSTVVATWTGGGLLDGLYSWSPDRGFLAYVTSDPRGVDLHLLSAGGDRVVTRMGAVTGRPVNPYDDDAFLGFSPDGAYFALVQTFTSSGDQVQVRRTTDGSLVYSHASGTMATWGSFGSKLYFRQPHGTAVTVWDPSRVAQVYGSPRTWISPRVDAGADFLTVTYREEIGIPQVWNYRGEAAGATLTWPRPRSSSVFLNTSTIFYVEEGPCGLSCGLGQPVQPDGKTFTFDISNGNTFEQPSAIGQVMATWPRPGQV